MPGDDRCTRTPRRRSALTLIEVLVVLAVIAILLAILLPAINAARSRMLTLKCASNMRTVAVEFQLFATGDSARGQGDSAQLGPSRFRINDFQESLYRIDEFWDRPELASDVLDNGEQVMLCPAQPGDLRRNRGFPCSSAALGPPENVSTALNMRLQRAVVKFAGRPVLAPVATTSVRATILDKPYVPLAFDVDGQTAAQRGVEPFYIAPPVPGEPGPYAEGRYWAPSTRHHGQTNVAFVGGHVLSVTDPVTRPWNWTYQADVGR